MISDVMLIVYIFLEKNEEIIKEITLWSGKQLLFNTKENVKSA